MAKDIVGAIPTPFNIAYELLNRLEDPRTGKIKFPDPQ
jgi:hypothetical protein